MHLLTIRQEKSPATETKKRARASSDHLLFAVLLFSVFYGIRSKAYRPSWKSEATTNITFMMIEFDLCGVSDLKIHILFSCSFGYSGVYRVECHAK